MASTTLSDFFGDGSADNTPECNYCGRTNGVLIVSISDHNGPTHWHHQDCQDISDETKASGAPTPIWDEAMGAVHEEKKLSLKSLVKSLIKSAEVKDFTNIDDWIAYGDTDGMTPQEIADEWDELPAMETDS